MMCVWVCMGVCVMMSYAPSLLSRQVEYLYWYTTPPLQQLTALCFVTLFRWRSRSVLQLQVSSAAMGDRWTLLSTRTARSDLSTSACTSWLHRENEEAEADSLRATASEGEFL